MFFKNPQPAFLPISRRRWWLAVLGWIPVKAFPFSLRFALAAEKPILSEVEVFRATKAGYHTYRIPSLIATAQGTLLAFCEGRKTSRSDTGDIDLVLKRSFDNGKSWGPLQLVADHSQDTIGNPCPVMDSKTGAIWLLLTANPGTIGLKEILEEGEKGTRTVWVTRSDDDGATWSPLLEITALVKKPDWTWYATGPGNGIQLQDGRLLIPCDLGRKGSLQLYSHVIYRDDHGKSWNLGGTASANTDECQVVELADGSLLLNMRSNHGKNRRALATSRDGGLTWSEIWFEEALVEPVCQASFLRFTKKPGHAKNRLLFSNPADTQRVRMTVRLSYDEGRTWPISKSLYQGPSAYSSLVVLQDLSLGCLYERGIQHPYESITFARFNLTWLTEGADSLTTE